jgi:hypothetical protein
VLDADADRAGVDVRVVCRRFWVISIERMLRFITPQFSSAFGLCCSSGFSMSSTMCAQTVFF